MAVKFDKISVVGLGYIGLPTAAMFAEKKIKVIGVDVNENAVETINRGEIHIVESGLDVVVKRAVTQGFLCATTIPEPASAFLIAVPTPFKEGATGPYEPDLSYIESASRAIAPVLKKGDLVILESTSPVGATEKMAAWLAESRSDLTFPQTHGEESDIRVAHCPERVLPGKVLVELVQNDRVIGGMTPRCSEEAALLYKIFVKGECVITNARTAEMAKLAENSFRDVNIAFANELSIVCDKQGVDVWELIRLANRHPRVNILQPGPGVGGHCIAVDPWFIVSASPKEAKLIRAAREVNDSKPTWVLDKLKIAVEEHLQKNPGKNKTEVSIACLGLAFKADIDDLRESPSAAIARSIATSHSGRVLAVEPNIHEIPGNWNSRLELQSLENALGQADIFLLLVDHTPFKKMDKKMFEGKILIDCKGIF